MLQEFRVGPLVLLHNSKCDTKKVDKMQPKWLGPYTIVSSIGKDLYQIETEKVLKQAVHAV